MKLKFKKLNEKAQIPRYNTPWAAAFDLHCIEYIHIEPGDMLMVSTGLACEIPENHALLITPRSGLAAKYSMSVVNSPGIVDADYRGEIKVLLINSGTNLFTAEPGSRIAQAMVIALPSIEIEETTEDLSTTLRGEGGFGSTGI